MKTFALTLGLLATALALTGGALAQDAVETVTSEALRARDDTVARRFLQSFLPPSPTLDNEYARWKQPICPHVYGLNPVAAYMVERRIRDIAAEAGAPVNRDDPCIANIGIIFTADPQASLDSIIARRPELVLAASRRLKVRFPVQSWYATFLRDHDGKLNLDQDWEDAGMDGPAWVPANDSRVKSGITAEMGAATVLVDSKAVTGMTLDSVADYLALLTLTQTQVTGRCQDMPTIANLMTPGCNEADHVTSLSPLDTALLAGLYNAAEKPELLQRQRIITAMKRSLEAQRRP